MVSERTHIEMTLRALGFKALDVVYEPNFNTPDRNYQVCLFLCHIIISLEC